MNHSDEKLNWSRVIDPRLDKGPERIHFLMKEIAEKLNSEMAMIMRPDFTKSGIWKAPSGWMYSELGAPAEITIPETEEFIGRTLAQESFVLDRRLQDRIPSTFEQIGVYSLISATIKCEKCRGLLVVCNSKNIKGIAPYQVCFQRADIDLALVIARVISMDGVGVLLSEGSMGLKKDQNETWEKEKRELLQKFPGWYVAYQEGTRIALEPSLTRLVATINEKLGVPHKPCEFYEIVDKVAERRGPSPRLMPTQRREESHG